MAGGTVRHVEYFDFYDECFDYFEYEEELRKTYRKDLIKIASVPSADLIVYHVVDWDLVKEYTQKSIERRVPRPQKRFLRVNRNRERG